MNIHICRCVLSAWAVVAFAFFTETSFGGFVYVANQGSGTVGLYTDTGVAVNPNLITGLQTVEGLAVADGFLYVSTFGSGIGVFTGKVGKYTLLGEPVNPSLITGLAQPTSIAISGNDLYVNNAGSANVGKYTTSGATVNPSFITVTGGGGDAVAVSGSTVFVAIGGNYRIASYSAATGAVINNNLIPNQVQVTSLTVSGSDLYAVRQNSVGKYTTSGAVQNASLITGLNNPFGVTVDGSNLFVSSFFPNSLVGRYTTSGATINSSLISTGLNRPYGIAAVAAIPEPTTLIWGVGILCVSLVGRRRLPKLH